MKILLLILLMLSILSGCNSREPLGVINEPVTAQNDFDEIVIYSGNASVKSTSGDPCKFAMIELPDTFCGYPHYFYADTRGFICLKYYNKRKNTDSDPEVYLSIPCIIYRNQLDKSIYVKELIEVKHGDNCLDKGLKSLIIVFTDSLEI